MLPSHRIDGPAGAPVLLLGSSLGTTADMWAPQVPTLAQRFRVVRYEHPGHGEPSTPIPPTPITIADLGTGVVELLDHLGVERASLAGVSLGGMVSMWVAAHAPERVDRLVLACTAAHLPPASGMARAGRARAPRGHRPVAARAAGPLVHRGLPAPPGPTSSNAVAAMLAAADPEGYASCCEAIASMDLRADLAAITAPRWSSPVPTTR